MIEMGLVVAFGLLVSLAKLPWRQKVWMTSHPLFMDIAVFVLLSVLHWGTFSGMMVATVGALFCSVTLSLARIVIGHVDRGEYHPGWMNIGDRL